VQQQDDAESSLVLSTDFNGEDDLLAFNPRSTCLAVGSFADHVLLIEPHTGREIGRIRNLRVSSLSWLSSEILLVVHDGNCSRYDLRKRQLVPVWSQPNRENAAYPLFVQGALASPDGRLVALGTTYGRMLLYDVTRRRVRHSLQTRLTNVAGPMAFSTEGRQVGFSLYKQECNFRGLMIVDTKTGRRLRTYEVGFPQAVAFQGESIGVIDGDYGKTYLYELTGGEDPVEEFPGCGVALRFAEGTRTLELLGQDGSLLRLRRGKSRVLRLASAPAWCEELAHVVASPDWLFLAAHLENKVIIRRTDRAEPAAAADGGA
jgi:hypothetical protein